MECGLLHSAQPKPLYEDAPTIAARCGFIRTLDPKHDVSR
jgi:hypothetical protein